MLDGYAGGLQPGTSRFRESQVLRDNQFYDIQSVPLDGVHSMLFLQSAHSISIYAPTLVRANEAPDCDTQYALVQRLPTKGANRFLVFADQSSARNMTTTAGWPLGHFLVLSKDDCEQQKYSTIILKARFK